MILLCPRPASQVRAATFVRAPLARCFLAVDRRRTLPSQALHSRRPVARDGFADGDDGDGGAEGRSGESDVSVKVTLTDIDAPSGDRIVGEGAGGVAGFAKGGAKVRLEEESADVTILHYEADAQIGGKLAQLGARLIDSTSRKLAANFFENFAAVVAPSL